MITSIDKLQNLGIYKEIAQKNINEFNRFNLIYGWNGSGKSTLSRLFRFLGSGNFKEKYEKLKVSFTLDDKQYSEKQIPLDIINIAVFNEDFIKDNIDWNGTIKSILLFDEKNIGDVKKYNELKNELSGNLNQIGLKDKYIKDMQKLDKLDNEMQSLLTHIAKTVKNNFQLLDTNDTYYSNYDKKKLKLLINNENSPLSLFDVLDTNDLKKAIQKAKQEKKPPINTHVELLDITSINQLIKKTIEIITRKVSSKVISDLCDNLTLSTWVQQGFVVI